LDISGSQSDESTQGKEAQREDVPANPNDNDSDIDLISVNLYKISSICFFLCINVLSSVSRCIKGIIKLRKQRFNIRIYLEVKATKVHKVKKHKEKTFQLILCTFVALTSRYILILNLCFLSFFLISVNLYKISSL
jgi:hypothetical protein